MVLVKANLESLAFIKQRIIYIVLEVLELNSGTYRTNLIL